MIRFGREVRSAGTVYFTGGVSAVLLGWREMTLDADIKADPEPAGFFEAIALLKEEVNINIELASPDDFLPALPDWRERSVFIAAHGHLTFAHYDFYGQALAKIERDHPRDRNDVAHMLASGLVKPARLLELLGMIEPRLIRFPGVSPALLRARVEAIRSPLQP